MCIRDSRKEWLGKYKTFNEFYKRFEVTPDMLAQLVATGKEMGVEYNEEEYQKEMCIRDRNWICT